MCRYIKWTQETFPAGGHKAELLPILEMCTRQFQDNPEYKNDIRYLRVWIQYADCVPDPSDIFVFLKQKNIGQEHALFFIAHATFLELKGSFSDADRVYQEGIDFKANPIERLKTKFLDFQHRMARRIQRKASEGNFDGGSTEMFPERKSLAVVGGASARSSGLASQKRKNIDSSSCANELKVKKDFDVFIDEEFGGPFSDLTGQQNIEVENCSQGWERLPSFAQSIKENSQKPSTWTGHKIKQVQMISSTPAPALTIPLDPEFELDNRGIHSSSKPSMTLRQQLDEQGKIGYHKHDPLYLHRCKDKGSSLSSKIPREQLMAACTSPLFEENLKDELSFEELRAQNWFRKHDVDSEQRHFFKQDASRTLDDRDGNAGMPTPFDVNSGEDIASTMDRSLSDVTLTTRGAFEAANALFTRSFAIPNTSLDRKGTLDLPNRDEADNKFQELKHLKSAETSGLADPTITINTKSAFEALQAAFGSSFPHESDHANKSFAAATTENIGGALKENSRDENDDRGDFDIMLDSRSEGIFSSPNCASDSPRTKKDSFIHSSAGQQGMQVFASDDTTCSPKSFQCNNSNGSGNLFGDSLNIREDTIFINQIGQEALTIPGEETIVLGDRDKQNVLGNSGTANQSIDCLDIREDTIFISEYKDVNESEINGETKKLGDRNDTMTVHRIFENGAVPCTTDDENFSNSLSGNFRDLRIVRSETTLFVENDENIAPNGTHDPDNNQTWRNTTVSRNLLQPLDDGLLETRGIEVEQNQDSDAALALENKSTILQESFECWVPPEETPNLINPFLENFQDLMLDQIQPPVHSWPDVTALNDTNLNDIFIAAANYKRNMPKILEIGHDQIIIDEIIGEGSFARVHHGFVKSKDSREEREDALEVAVKVQSPKSMWEFYLLKVINGRVDDTVRKYYARPQGLILSEDSSCLLLPFKQHGTLQDLINSYRIDGEKMSEYIAILLSTIVLRQIGHLHAAHILHNDIKPDNFLVDLKTHASNDDEKISLELIDFGRGVDLKLLTTDTVMVGDSTTESFRCLEMREEQPWLWQADAYGAAGVIHCLLFGDYMEVEKCVPLGEGAPSFHLRIKNQFRRYWQTDIWELVFDTLLNWKSKDHNTPPPCLDLADKLESCSKSRKVKQSDGEVAKTLHLLQKMLNKHSR